MHMSLKAIIFLCTLLSGHSISAELLPGDKSTDILLRGRIKRELPIYKFVPGRTSKGIQGPFYYAQAIDQEEEDRPRTFFQRYWVKDMHYQEKGPIFLVVGGDVDAEAAAPSLLDENSVSGRLARKNGGMMVLLEHRYFGKSFPVEDLSENNLSYLTIVQVLDDIEQFALRGLNGKFEELRPGSRVPWILIGSGYAGGIVHWELARDHGLFWAGYSLSGRVHATLDFSQYWRDVAKGMPPECAENIGRVVLYFDDAGEHRDTRRMRDLRDILGLQKVVHFDDVASVLSAGIRSLNKPRNEASLTMFCEALSDGAREKDAIGGILREFGVYIKRKYGNDTDEKWTTYDRNAPKYTDISLSPVSLRVSHWLICMRLGWFRTAPQRTQRIISLQLNLDREERICKNYFPAKYQIGIDPQVERTNSEYGPPDNWPKRAVYLNEENDPYHRMTVLAHLKNKLEVKGRMAIVEKSEIIVVTKEDQEIYEEEGDKYIKKWLDVWYRDNSPAY